ncbi:TonB-dependent receptor [Halosquirtibacter xylanolyticus]|uniref:SusC/RagA family TonB-linked outer membrane protein n=1 Tax=Halosquirtibacter xylanolyticus TaxID=3374599 RepID=UPI003747FF5C|nr:TonB-dependent receptor [Prolixibacteraceae bacterium]
MSISVNAQTSKITGAIFDEKGQPLPGVAVMIKGTTKGTASDFDGKYAIDAIGNSTLIYSYLGFQNQEVLIKGRTQIDVTMKENITSLDEVVAIGYGSMKKKDLTGSVASVKSEDITKSAGATLDQGLQGKVAGVHVMQNSATPGGGVSVRIRGVGGFNNSEPLYVVDGVPIAASGSENSNPLSSINPNDIASLDILKDAASAAIYGARAANGVIIITTKKGKKGEGVVSYNGYYGVQKIYNAVETMTGADYAQYMKNASTILGKDYPLNDPESYGEGTDWVDAITQIAPIQDHQISFSGASDKGHFFISAGYLSQEGTTKGTSFERFTLRTNVDRQIKEWFKVGANISFSNSKQNNLSGGRNNFNSLITSAYTFYPTIPVYDENGNYSPTEKNSLYKPIGNPLFFAERERYPAETNKFMANVFANLNLTKDLSFKTAVSYTYTGSYKKGISDTYDLGTAIQDRQSVGRGFGRSTNLLHENTLNYKLKFGSSSLQSTLGQSYQESVSENLNVGTKYQDNGYYVVSANGVDPSTISNGIQEHGMLSFFGRVFLNLDERFLITANIRRDGSSRFGSNNKWGVFPSISAGWRISEEAFFPKEGIISSMKIRGGWGQVGNNGIGNYAYSASMVSGFSYPFGDNYGKVTNGVASRSLANPDVMWETVTQTSYGVDAYLFDNKLSVTAEYFTKHHSDMLISVQQSAVTGISSGSNPGSMVQNIAELTNSGVELSLNYTNNIDRLTYTVGGNITTFNNKVWNVGRKGYYESFSFQGSRLTRTQEGRELGEFYGYVADGLFQKGEADSYTTTLEDGTKQKIQPNAADGDIRFKDLNGDGEITEDDRTFIGSPVPDFTYALNAEVSYANVSLSVAFNGVYGNDVMNLTKRSMLDPTRGENKMVHQPWTPEMPNTPYFRAHPNDPNQNIRFSSYYVESGAYLRCSLIQLGYELPKGVKKAMHFSKFRIYGSVKNPFTFTNYSGVDPEVGANGGSNLQSGVDHFLYPPSRTFIMGVNISF